ncbi:MAG: 1-acyl-sn-glycerol-3-phosphate acyltransferase [Chloroflexota bacterium]|nr:MAG: 1-acyl-sn-glycerol-3-phosphate acyltransferase [Chloroflexota bacterium]
MTELGYSKAWRTFADAGMYVLMHLTLKLDLGGFENVPPTGPLMIIINHNSFLDPLVPCVFVRHDVFPMAKVEALEHWLGWTLKWYGAFPVRRGAGDVSALKSSLRVLKAGHALLMAPEGTRNPEGILQEGHEGAALIAARSGVPILPIAMRGGAPFFKNLKRLRRTPITMRIGMPLIVRPLEQKLSRDELRALTDEMMYALAALLPIEMRGRYADVEKFALRYLLPYDTFASTTKANAEVMPLTN